MIIKGTLTLHLCWYTALLLSRRYSFAKLAGDVHRPSADGN